MAVTAVRWVPASSLRRFGDAARSALGAWALRWGLPGPQVDAPEPLSMQQAAAGLAVLHPLEGLPESMAWWSCGGKGEPSWALALLGTAPLEGSALVDCIVGAARQSLAAALAVELSAARPASSARAREAPGAPGHWGAALRWRCGGAAGQLAVAWEWMAAKEWVEVPSAGPLPRWAAGNVCAHLPVALTATLGRATLPAAELAALDVGDVVLLEPGTREGLVELRAQACGLGLAAQLVHAQHRRAAQVMTIEGGGIR